MTTRISSLTDIEVLSAASRNSLEDYCHYLLSTLPADYAEFFAEPALPGKKVSVAILTDIAAQIEHAQLLETHPIAAMVATVAGRSTSERSKHESLKAWALLASLAFTDRFPMFRKGCARVRRLACKEDRWLFEELLDTKSELEAIVHRLADLLRKHSDKNKVSKSKYRKVSHLHALLADLYYRREKRGPGVGGQLVAGPTIVERLVATQVDNCLFPDVESARILNDELSFPGPRNGAEVRSTSERYLDGVANDDYPTVLKRRVQQGRRLAQSFTMRSIAAQCAWEGLSENEVQRTLSSCYDKAISGCRPSLWIVLSLLLGRTPERLWSMSRQIYGKSGSSGEYWRVNKKKIQLVGYLSLPDFQLDNVDQQLVEPVYNCLLLPVPKSLIEPLRTVLKAIWADDVSSDDLRLELKDCIKKLNSDNNTRLTSNRLAAYLHRWLIHAGHNDVVSKRLRGIDAKVNFKQRYEANFLDDTRLAYCEYATALLEIVDRVDDWQVSDCKPIAFGTHLRVRDEAVRYLFDDLRQRASLSERSFDGACEFHNRYAMHAYQLLMIASGHRPVRVPLDTLCSFDAVSQELFICDKVANRAYDSRTIVLPQIACQQIDHYIHHLRALERRSRRSAPEISPQIQKAVEGNSALLFRIERNRRNQLVLVPFDPTHVNRWLEEDWTLPLNWHRHWLRSKLTESNHPHEYIDQFLGHEDDQPPGLSPFSNLTYAGRKAIADRIQGYLTELGITPLEEIK